MQIIKSIILDLNRGKSYGCVEVHQGETGGRYIEAKIQRDGRPFEIPDTFSATINACINSKIVAENVACEINPKEGDTSIVLIPITKYMCAERGRVEVNLLLSEGEETVIAQTVYIMIIKSAIEDAENIYSDISKVNEVLSETLEGEDVDGVLDENRLDKLPAILSEYKTELEEQHIEVKEPFYYDDIVESSKTVYQKGYDHGYNVAGSELAEDIAEVNSVLSQTVQGREIGETLDEERLNRLPEILADSKTSIANKRVEIKEPFYLDDIPNAVDSIEIGEPIGSFENGYNQGKTDGYNDGHEAGYSEGHEQGKTDEWDAFWEQLQLGGAERDYQYAFSGSGWTDSNFKPKYKVLRSHNQSSRMFADTAITDVTDVYLDFSNEGHNINYLFYGSQIEKIGVLDISGAYNSQETYQSRLFAGCENLKSIEKLIIRSTGMHVNNAWFENCTSLTDITFEGGRSLAKYGMNCKQCPFTVETAKSLINHLADMSGTSNEYVWSVTFSPITWSYLDAEGDTASPNGNSWREYIYELGWNT